MRVLIAPDCFGSTMTARAAAAAIAEGWRRGAPDAELVLRPLADGGPGFVDVLHGALGGAVHHLDVTGPEGDPVPATWLEHEGTGYVESAQAVGLHLVAAPERTAETATSGGVGELVAAARDAGMHTVVVGLGGTASTDGGAGLLGALGDVGELRLVGASDVDNPLLGQDGAARVFGPQKGADADAVERLERRLTELADRLDPGAVLRELPGAGAAGGIGFALLVSGGTLVSGAGLVRERTGLDAALDGCRLVVTGEGSFDWQSLRGKLVTGVASAASARGVPCIVLAGQVQVGGRRAAAAGVDATYSVSEHVGSVEASLADPPGTLAALAEHVARQWR